jgi:hypothetical protein
MSSKRISHKHFILVLLIAMQSVCLAASGQTGAVDLEKRVKVDGARAVVDQLYRNENKWNAVLRHIAHGEAQWVELGSELYGAADGGAREMLAEAFGEALEHAPARILDLAKRQVVRIDQFCIGPDVDDERYSSSYDAAVKALQRRIESVKSVQISELALYKGECLASLSDAGKGLAQFFGR